MVRTRSLRSNQVEFLWDWARGFKFVPCKNGASWDTGHVPVLRDAGETIPVLHSLESQNVPSWKGPTGSSGSSPFPCSEVPETQSWFKKLKNGNNEAAPPLPSWPGFCIHPVSSHRSRNVLNLQAASLQCTITAGCACKRSVSGLKSY